MGTWMVQVHSDVKITYKNDVETDIGRERERRERKRGGEGGKERETIHKHHKFLWSPFHQKT